MKIQTAIIPVILPLYAYALINMDAGPLTDGRATYYDYTETVACDIPTDAWPDYVAALSEPQFQDGLACGASAKLQWTSSEGEENSIDVMIVDLCPTADNKKWCSGDSTHFDLMDSNTFALLELPKKGVLHGLTYTWQPAPVTGNLKYRFKAANGFPWYAPVQVYNSIYPIANVEIMNYAIDDVWVPGDRTQSGLWNWWVFNWSRGLQPGFIIRVTDQYGQTIVDTVDTYGDTDSTSGYAWESAHQFPEYVSAVESPSSATNLFSLNHGNLQISADFAPVRMSLLDVNGHILESRILSSSGTYPLPNFATGVRILRVESLAHPKQKFSTLLAP
ncbi:MAG TPA: hypothetical protein VLM37_04005 [Fibrobacteraceae bacterium]|nr:hypothetical protein [Fibrobacteraceae bacterium]